MSIWDMKFVDAIEATIAMTKSEGTADLSKMKAAEIKKSMMLIVNDEVLKELGFTHYRVMKGGEKSETISFEAGGVSGYPTLKVRVYCYPDRKAMKGDVFRDDRALLGSAFTYKLGSNSDDFFFFDGNGETDVVRAENECKTPDVFDEKVLAKCTTL